MSEILPSIFGADYRAGFHGGLFDAALVSGPDKWFPYCEGFRRAADAIVDGVELSPRSQNLLIYPVLYLYRHHIELALKLIYLEGAERNLSNGSFLATHDLNKLWAKAKGVLASGDLLHGQGVDFETVERLIEELHEVDPHGEAFRYPVGRRQEPSLPVGLTHANFGAVRSAVGLLADSLDVARMAICYTPALQPELQRLMEEEWTP